MDPSLSLTWLNWACFLTTLSFESLQCEAENVSLLLNVNMQIWKYLNTSESNLRSIQVDMASLHNMIMLSEHLIYLPTLRVLARTRCSWHMKWNYIIWILSHVCVCFCVQDERERGNTSTILSVLSGGSSFEIGRLQGSINSRVRTGFNKREREAEDWST